LNKVISSLSSSKNGAYHHSSETGASREQWVTTLFVQFRLSQAAHSFDGARCLADYRAKLDQAIQEHGGDIVAMADDAALAIFSGYECAAAYTRDGLTAARAIMAEMSRANKERLAQDLPPLRVAIGLDAGILRSTSCRRHPRLDPGLEQFLRRARRLSDLNYQTPFPAIFASRAVVDSLDFGGPDTIHNLGDVFVEGQASPIVVYAIISQP
jgi:class 3 adenylate cyclase